MTKKVFLHPKMKAISIIWKSCAALWKGSPDFKIDSCWTHRLVWKYASAADVKWQKRYHAEAEGVLMK